MSPIYQKTDTLFSFKSRIQNSQNPYDYKVQKNRKRKFQREMLPKTPNKKISFSLGMWMRQPVSPDSNGHQGVVNHTSNDEFYSSFCK